MTRLHQFNLDDGLNIVHMSLGTATTFDRFNMKSEDWNGNAGSRVSQYISNCLRINALKCSNRQEL